VVVGTEQGVIDKGGARRLRFQVIFTLIDTHSIFVGSSVSEISNQKGKSDLHRYSNSLFDENRDQTEEVAAQVPRGVALMLRFFNWRVAAASLPRILT